MEGGLMQGKTLGVIEYNLTFGTNTRLVNVFSCFRYKKNNNLYVIYADIETKYEIVHYGSSHIKNNSILSMSCKPEEVEIIKEFIYKLINNEELSDFEPIDLTEATGIEIISSNNLEIKLEVIRKLEELTIPVIKQPEKEQPEYSAKPKKEKKNNPKNKILLVSLLIIIIILGGGYFYLSTIMSNTVSKKIICTKDEKHALLNANLKEVTTYTFLNNNELSRVEGINTYTFNDEIDYQNFTNKGTYYKYLPNDAIPNWDNSTNTFEVSYSETIDSSYTKPKRYEEVIDYYKNKGYSCTEKIEKE